MTFNCQELRPEPWLFYNMGSVPSFPSFPFVGTDAASWARMYRTRIRRDDWPCRMLRLESPHPSEHDERHPDNHQPSPCEPLPQPFFLKQEMSVQYPDQEAQPLYRDHVRHVGETQGDHTGDDLHEAEERREEGRPENPVPAHEPQFVAPLPECDRRQAEKEQDRAQSDFSGQGFRF